MNRTLPLKMSGWNVMILLDSTLQYGTGSKVWRKCLRVSKLRERVRDAIDEYPARWMGERVVWRLDDQVKVPLKGVSWPLNAMIVDARTHTIPRVKEPS